MNRIRSRRELQGETLPGDAARLELEPGLTGQERRTGRRQWRASASSHQDSPFASGDMGRRGAHMGPELLRRRPEPADFYFQSTEAAFCKTNNLPGPAPPPPRPPPRDRGRATPSGPTPPGPGCIAETRFQVYTLIPSPCCLTAALGPGLGDGDAEPRAGRLSPSRLLRQSFADRAAYR